MASPQHEELFGGVGVMAGAIRFTAVTITADPPELDETSPAPVGAESWHEDDWRQVELVSSENIEYLNRVFEEQHHFRRKHSEEYGFTGLYLRKEFPIPLAALNIPVEDLVSLGGSEAAATDLYMGPTAGSFRVKNARLLDIPNVCTLYYSETNSLVRHAGLIRKAIDVGPDNQTLAAIHAFASRHSLLLVDWYKLSGFYLTDIDSLVEWLGWEVPPHAES